MGSTGVRRLLWRSAVGTTRAVGRLSAPTRPMPDFLIVGAQRCGTTSLHRYLLQHPAVLGARLAKGVHWFDEHYDRSPGWYRSHFPTVAQRRSVEQRTGAAAMVGESSPYYLFHPFAAERVAAHLPDVRAILLLRDPVQRAWSHFQHNVARGMENLSFVDALDAEPSRLAGAEAVLETPGAVHLGHRRGSYVGRGRYAEQLDRYLHWLGPEQVLTVFTDDLDRDPEGTVAEVQGFLGLPPQPVSAARRWNRQEPAVLAPGSAERLEHAFAESDAQLAERLQRPLPWTAGRSAR